MQRVSKVLAGIVVFGGTLASLAVLGFDATAKLFVIIIGVIVLYQSIARR